MLTRTIFRINNFGGCSLEEDLTYYKRGVSIKQQAVCWIE